MPEPSAMVAVVLAGGLYWRGVRILWLRAGRNHVVQAWQAACFGAGLLTLTLALESPLDALGGELFAAHMVQHLLLLVVAAPLVVLGAPLVPMLWALAETSRRGLGSWLVRANRLGRPGVAFGLHSLALWVWHIPGLYDAAVGNRWLHVLEHVSFVATAILFWWAVLYGRRVGHGAGVVYVFGLALESTVLGALLAFSPVAWYTSYAGTTLGWGMTAVEDQQVAGLIMWVPGGAVYLVAALGLFAASQRGPDTAETTVPSN